MSYIFLIAAFNAIFFAVLLFQKKQKSRHDNILIGWLIYLGAYIGIYGLAGRILFADYPLLSAVFISLLLLHGPFLYIYISALLKEINSFKWTQLLHFLPFILFNCYLLLVSSFAEVRQTITLSHSHSPHNPPLLFQAFLVLTALSGPVYFWFSTRLFKALDISILNNFSSAEDVNPTWLRKLVYLFGAVWTLLMITAFIHHVFHLFSWVFCTDGIFLSLSGFIILMGYFGLKQKDIFVMAGDKPLLLKQSTEKYATSSLKSDDIKTYANKLEQYIFQEKPYLNPVLSLPQLANAIDMPVNHLSQVINTHFEMSFFDFINTYRVQEVKARINDPEYERYSLLGIAFESGFNSKSAFNRVFKKLTGSTPSEFKRQNSS